MKRYTDDQVAALRALLPDYLAAVHGVTDLRRPFRCLHPEHEDKHPSMSYHVDGGGVPRVRCFACGWSGDVLDLAQLDGARGFTEAARAVESACGAEVGAPTGGGAFSYRPPIKAAKAAPAADVCEEREDILDKVFAANEALFSPEGAEALAYLYGRGFTDEEIVRHGLGWTPRPHEVMDGFGESLRSDGGFLVLPFPEPHWRACRYCVCRPMGASRAKEIKPAGTAAPLWREHLLSAGGEVIVTEGIFDAVAIESLDGSYGSTVALMGCGGVGRMLDVIEAARPASRPNVVLALDSDDAGTKATERAREGLQALHVPCAVLPMPEGVHDPNDWLLDALRGEVA